MSDDVTSEPVDTGIYQADIAATHAAQVAEPEPTEAVAEIDADESDEQNDTEAPAPSDGNDPPAKPKNKGVGKRIDELTRDKYDAIRERDYWREQAQQRAQPQEAPQAQAPSTGKPTLESCNWDQEAFSEALTDWKVEQKFQAIHEHQQRTHAEQAYVARVSTFQAQIAELEQEQPGAWDEATSAPIATTPALLEALHESPKGARIAHYLATHLDEAAAIARLSPLATAREIGRLEAQLSTPVVERSGPPKTVTKAPAPVSTLRPAAQIKKDLGEMDMGEYIAERNRQRKAAGLIP